MLAYLRLVRIVQKFVKQFSTQAQRNYKIIELGVSGGRQNVCSTLLKKTQSLNEPASTNHKITLLSFLGSKQNEYLLLKHNQIAELKSRNYTITALSKYRKSGRKNRDLLKRNQILNRLASREYNIAVLGTYNQNKNFLLNKNLLLTDLSLRNYKVAIVGAAGAIGQNVSLLLKINPLIKTLALYDMAKITPGVAVDLSHINTCTRTTGKNGPKEICDCLAGADVVLVSAGLSRQPKMATRDDLFKINAPIVNKITHAIADNCPRAIVVLVSKPINSLVPLAGEIMRQRGISADSRIFGVTTLDLVRAATFVSQLNCSDPNSQWVPVVGGHGTGSIIPLLSQSSPSIYLDDISRILLTTRIQEGGAEVMKIKTHTATLSTAFAIVRFINAVLKGLRGDKNIVEYTYVKSCIEGCSYFAGPVVLCKHGAKTLGIGQVNDFERDLLNRAIPILKQNIQRGIEFVTNKKTEKCKQ